MTIEEFFRQLDGVYPTYEETWNAACTAERERIKSRVKEAAESLWCIRDRITNKPDGLYIGPPIGTLEQFVEKLLEEK